MAVWTTNLRQNFFLISQNPVRGMYLSTGEFAS